MSQAVKHLLEFGPFRIDPNQRLLLRDHQPIPLSPKAFELLLVLAQHSGEVVLKDDLMKILWPDTFVEESNLGQHIFQLRKALGESAQHPTCIVTVPGRGYRFAPRVRTMPAEAEETKAGIVPEGRSPYRIAMEQELPADRPRAPASGHGRVLLAGLSALAVLLTVARFFRPSTPPPRVLGIRQITHTGRVEPYTTVLTDGARLYFTEQMGGIGILAEAPAGGGEPELIATSVSSLAVYDIDQSKEKLLIAERDAAMNTPLWMVSTEGGSAQRVGRVLATEGAVWMPDGHSILYGNDAQLYTAHGDGWEPHKLSTAPGYVLSPRLAPNGKLLRFTVRDFNSGNASLWEASADGGNPHPMSFGWKTSALHWGEGESNGNWSPDGRYFVFRSIRDGVAGLWAVREKPDWFRKTTGLPVQLYTSPDRVSEARFSPDGKRIFFVNYQERRELVRYDSARKMFVPYLNGIPARFLSFSSDGKWVAYRQDSDLTLWRSRLDGTERLQLTFPPLQVLHSSWSPDGRNIVFEGRPPGEAARLYLLSSEGGSPEALTSPDASDTGPSWCPNGRLVLFQHWTTQRPGSRHSAIYILDMNTRKTRMLAGSNDFDGVHCSPDGRHAAAADETGHRLVLFDFAREQWSLLADGPPNGWGIRWSSDSRYVYYQHSLQGEEQPIFRVRVRDRGVEQITSARQILRADVLGYTLTGLTPDGSPLASLIRRNSDVYALELDLP